MRSGLRLISTDFDGTLVGHPSDGRCVPALGQALADFKAAGGLWAVNTGRSLEHIVEGVAIFSSPVAPDFLLTHEREIYHCEAGKWRSFGGWNQLCRQRHAELFSRSAEIFRRVRDLVAGAIDVTLLEEEGELAGLITSDEQVMDHVVASIEKFRQRTPKFSYQRNTIYLRFCHQDYHKGSALGELCRLLGISRDEVFAAGDQFNDLSMLDGRYARHVGCPGNAIPEVKAMVAAGGGYVASKNDGEGTAAALRALLEVRTEKKPATAW
jgi:hydroxymethylpyrimidine pyrophosphatase-like HAD family hydrolase